MVPWLHVCFSTGANWPLMLISLLFTGRDSTCITTRHLTWSIEQVRKCSARGSVCGLALTTDEVTRRPCRREFKMKKSSGELLYRWDHLKRAIMEFIWSVSSTEALTQKCQRITQRRAQIVGNNTVLHKVDERYLKPGFRGPTWSPDAGSGRPCAPLGSWAPVRRVEGTAGRGRTGRARRGPMGRAWQGRRSGGRRRRAERLRIKKNNNTCDELQHIWKFRRRSLVSAGEGDWQLGSASFR